MKIARKIATALCLFLILSSTSGAADLKIKNASSTDIWASYAMKTHGQPWGNYGSHIAGGWSIKPGETKTIHQAENGYKAIFLNIWPRNGQQWNPSGRRKFTLGRSETFVTGTSSSNKYPMYYCKIPEWAQLHNTRDGGFAVINDLNGRRVSAPKFQLFFPGSGRPEYKESSLFKSIRKSDKHVFVEVSIGKNGGTFTYN